MFLHWPRVVDMRLAPLPISTAHSIGHAEAEGMRACIGFGSHAFRKGCCADGNTSAGVRIAEYVAVAGCRHPTSPGEVSVINTTSTLFVAVNIEA